MGDETMNPQTQSEHPQQTPTGDADAPPKVDAGDSGATVGTPGSAAGAVEEAQAHVQSVLDDEGRGYIGYNPDETDNSVYAMPNPGSESEPGDTGEEAAVESAEG